MILQYLIDDISVLNVTKNKFFDFVDANVNVVVAAFVVVVFFVIEILCCWITRESLAFTFCVVVNRNNFGGDVGVINPAVA